MSRWLGLLLLTISGLLLLFHRASEAPAAQQAADKLAPQADEHHRQAPSVRVEHELIEVMPLPAPAPRARAVVAAADRSPRRTAQPQDFVSRARRALVGDGRYRPEPFPRPGSR